MQNASFENQYTVLDIPDFSSADVIKKAYRKLALKYHPDKNKTPGAEDKFKAVSAANEILTDETQKEAHDATLRELINAAMPGLGGIFQGFANWFTSNQSPPTPQNTSSRARFSENVLNVFDTLIKLGRMTEADITNISEDRIPFVSEQNCLNALKDNVFSLSEFNEIYADRIQHIINPTCLNALREKRFSLYDLNDIDFSKLPHVVTENCIEALKEYKTTFKQLMRMSIADIEEGNRTGNYPNDARSMLCEFHLASEFDIAHLSDTSLNHILGMGVIHLISGSIPVLGQQDFNIKWFKDKDDAFIDLLFSPTALKFNKEHPGYQREIFQVSHELLEVILSDDCANAVKDEKLFFHIWDVFKGVPADPLRALVSPIGVQLQKEFSFWFDSFKERSPEVLERITTPQYLKALLHLAQSHHFNLGLVPKDGKDTPYASYILKDRWGYHAEPIFAKAKEMEETAKIYSSYTKAAKVARALCDKLSKAKEAFLLSNDPLNAQKEFVTACLEAVKEARPELKKHRGWLWFAQVLLDFINALVSIATLFIPNMITGRLRLFEIPTDSSHKLANLETFANNLKSDVDKLESTPLNMAAPGA
ncbi:MAG: DnaJ domain-containing protein [Gammaproteobacteria bacterium]|nr:DnaJ domain-containing protein [Gammaproteobacteria bacterium]